MAIRQSVFDVYMEDGNDRLEVFQLKSGSLINPPGTLVVRRALKTPHLFPQQMVGRVSRHETFPSPKSTEATGQPARFSPTVVQAQNRFRPEEVSTISLRISGDNTIDHRLDVRDDHRKIVKRALSALIKRLDMDD